MMALVGVLIIVAAVVVGVAYGAMRNKRAFARQNEIVPGSPSRAPAGWAGAHSPEALLHRRLRGAVQAAQAQVSAAGSGFEEVIAAIGRGAQQIDDRLIAAAALPDEHRQAAIGAIEPSVAALEKAVAGLSESSASNDRTAVTAALAEAQQRLDALAAARAEIERVDVGEPTAPVADDAAAPDRPATKPVDGQSGPG